MGGAAYVAKKRGVSLNTKAGVERNRRGLTCSGVAETDAMVRRWSGPRAQDTVPDQERGGNCSKSLYGRPHSDGLACGFALPDAA